MDCSVPVSVLAGGLSEWQRCTGCRNRPPPPHPQPLCCHLLTRGRLRRTLPLAAPTPCPVARPMRARLAAGVGECASRCHIRAAATGGWRLSPPGGRDLSPFSLWRRKYVVRTPIYTAAAQHSCEWRPFNPFIHSISVAYLHSCFSFCSWVSYAQHR